MWFHHDIIVVSTSLLLALMCKAVTSCPEPQCSCNDLQLEVECNRADLDVVPYTLNPMIKRLSLVNNKIKDIRYSFSIYTRLLALDMSNNDVVNINTKTFEKQNFLISLNLSNNAISAIEPQSFARLRSLLILKLNGNKIVNVVSECFAFLTRLEKLDLSDNEISTLQVYAFKDLRSLRTLTLSNNNLETIPSPAFAPLNNLWIFDLCCNPITTLQKNAFKHLQQLRSLFLDSCSIKIIEDHAFTGLLFLRKLHLHDNATPKLFKTALKQLPRLQEITIGHIPEVEVIDAFAFSTVPNLHHIRVINAMSLRAIDMDAFVNNTQLETISLIDNKQLSKITKGSYPKNFSKLTKISLRGNVLTSIGENVLPWNSVKSLDLRDNNFICNCSLRWLRDLLISKRNRTMTARSWMSDSVVYPVTCSRETRHVINLLTDMSDSDLNCGHASNQQMLMLAVLSTVMCLIVMLFIAVVIRYRRFFQAKLGSPQKEAYIEPRRPIIGDTVSVMYDTCRSSPRRSNAPPTCV